MKSSKAWLRRHVSDAYVRQAKAQGYRSRAAFKLLELNEKDKFLFPGATVIDLGAAPGGWSQVAAQKVSPGGKVIAIDLVEIAPISGVKVLRGDFREKAPRDVKIDVILSDLSPNLSGIANVDQARSLELALGAIELCRKALKPEGVFVVKAFQGETFDEFQRALEGTFRAVAVRKPPASRGESRETYAVARGLLGL